MKAIQLRPYQVKAIDAIQAALDNGQKHIVVEMAAGSGKGLVLAKTIEILHKHKAARVLVVTNSIELKKMWNTIFSISIRSLYSLTKTGLQ